MENDGIKFYQVFGFGGTIGVNKLTFSDLIMVKGGTLIVMILLLGVLASIFPIIMVFVYAFLLLFGNWEQMQLDRVRVNIFAIFGYVYFMIDYHFGFVGWLFFYKMFGAEFVDKLCYINTALVILNILLMFFGNRLFNEIQHGIIRLAAFVLILFLSSKILIPIGKSLSPVIATQYITKPGDGVTDDVESVEDQNQEEMMDLDDEIEKHEHGRGNYNYRQPNDDEYIGRD